MRSNRQFVPKVVHRNNVEESSDDNSTEGYLADESESNLSAAVNDESSDVSSIGPYLSSESDVSAAESDEQSHDSDIEHFDQQNAVENQSPKKSSFSPNNQSPLLKEKCSTSPKKHSTSLLFSPKSSGHSSLKRKLPSSKDECVAKKQSKRMSSGSDISGFSSVENNLADADDSTIKSTVLVRDKSSVGDICKDTTDYQSSSAVKRESEEPDIKMSTSGTLTSADVPDDVRKYSSPTTSEVFQSDNLVPFKCKSESNADKTLLSETNTSFPTDESEEDSIKPSPRKKLKISQSDLNVTSKGISTNKSEEDSIKPPPRKKLKTSQSDLKVSNEGISADDELDGKDIMKYSSHRKSARLQPDKKEHYRKLTEKYISRIKEKKHRLPSTDTNKITSEQSGVNLTEMNHEESLVNQENFHNETDIAAEVWIGNEENAAEIKEPSKEDETFSNESTKDESSGNESKDGMNQRIINRGRSERICLRTTTNFQKRNQQLRNYQEARLRKMRNFLAFYFWMMRLVEMSRQVNNREMDQSEINRQVMRLQLKNLDAMLQQIMNHNAVNLRIRNRVATGLWTNNCWLNERWMIRCILRYRAPVNTPSGNESPHRNSPGNELVDSKSPDSKPRGNQSPDSKPRGNQSPDSKSPGNQSPDSKSPGNQSPDSKSPGNQSPDSKSPGNQSPDSKSPGNQSPDSKPRGNQSPDSKLSGNQSPDSKSPGNQSPDSKSPGNKSPDSIGF